MFVDMVRDWMGFNKAAYIIYTYFRLSYTFVFRWVLKSQHMKEIAKMHNGGL